MISLSLRLAVKGGREASARLLFTAIGVGLGVALLCFTLSGFNGLHAKDVREGWYTTSAENRQPSVDESSADPLWWRISSDRYDGDAILTVDVAATGANAPVPPGLVSVPEPGEYYVSPALARLLAEVPADQLRDRFPGRRAGLIAEDALSSPDSLVAVVGRTPAEVRDLPGAVAVRSIETAPREHTYSSFLKIVLGIGAVGLLLPVLVFVATSTRLAAARREERFAALRLVGATPRQVNTIASVEAFLGAFLGVLLGIVLWWVFRPVVARIPFTGEPFFTEDLSLGWLALLGITVGVPFAAAAVSLWSLRRVRISPLGVTRHVTPRPPRALRLIPLCASLVVLASMRYWEGAGTAAQWIVVGCFAAVAIGIVIAGPWLTMIGARFLSRYAASDATLIAGRRLADDPSRAFRSISGLILAIFIGTVFVGFVGTVIAQQPVINPSVVPASVMVAEVRGTLSAKDVERAGDALLTVPGVRAVVPVRVRSRGSGEDEADGSGSTHALIAAADWAKLGTTDAAPPGAAAVSVNADTLVYGDPHMKAADAAAASELDTLPVKALLITNNGQPATIERLRTAVELALPQTQAPLTIAEVDEEGWAMVGMLQRMVDVGIIVSLVIAGCSLAVSVASGLLERKRPFTLLRLTGMPLAHLRRVVMLEAVVPLTVVAVLSVAAGLAVAELVLQASGTDISLTMPGLGFWALVIGGLVAALAIVAATMPLLARVTEPQGVRME